MSGTQKEPPSTVEEADASVPLTSTEEEQVRKRTSLRAAVVFETVRREGESELNRPVLSLAFSGLAAGLSMGFSLVVTGLLRANLPDAPWRVLVENFGYTIGFLIVVLGRQQLFTENTVTAILPLLQNPNKSETLMKVARLWAAVLAANLLGAVIFAYVVAHSSIFPPNVQSAFLQLAQKTIEPAFWTIVVRGIFAGWLLALMVWLLPAADTQKLWVVLIITYVVGAAGLSHIIAGSVEALYGVAAGAISWSTYFGGFLLPVFIGNAIGGVMLVSLLNYGQVAPENPEN
ncbi:MAG: formate/nitrite transporter family protein [Candidatus Baltobacteraceae bacterium]